MDIERLCDIVGSTELNGLNYFVGGTNTGEHHNFLFGTNLFAGFQYLESVYSRHRDIEQHKLWRQSSLHALEDLLTAASCLYGIIVQFQQSSCVAHNVRIIIDE